jgi:serine phosphatase RsbU (regulator of sigma subunit)
VKKILFATLCTALLVSCASQKAAMVDSAIAEAKSLQALAKAQGIDVPTTADLLIASAEKKNEERQTEEAFILADEAILQLQLSILKKEQAELVVENNNAQASLNATNEALAVSRKLLSDSKSLPKERTK